MVGTSWASGSELVPGSGIAFVDHGLDVLLRAVARVAAGRQVAAGRHVVQPVGPGLVRRVVLAGNTGVVSVRVICVRVVGVRVGLALLAVVRSRVVGPAVPLGPG